VSHNFKGHAYLYGGGLYRRGNLKHVLFDQKGKRWQSTMKPLPEENIDYYLEVDEEEPVGATAIMAFRTQIFVTRSEVALVKGIQTGKPEIMGIYDSQGKYLRG
jgi:predicted amino acid racemase